MFWSRRVLCSHARSGALFVAQGQGHTGGHFKHAFCRLNTCHYTAAEGGGARETHGAARKPGMATIFLGQRHVAPLPSGDTVDQKLGVIFAGWRRWPLALVLTRPMACVAHVVLFLLPLMHEVARKPAVYWLFALVAPVPAVPHVFGTVASRTASPLLCCHAAARRP